MEIDPVQRDDEANSPVTNRDPPLPFVRALHNFTAEHINAIDLREGDRVEVIEEDDSGWWYGRNGTKRGWFPWRYCTPIIIGYARVLSLYHPDASAELDLNPGDMVEIHGTDSPEYWHGSIRQRTGLIKMSHCDVIEEDDVDDAHTPDASEAGDEADIERWHEEAYRAGIWL